MTYKDETKGQAVANSVAATDSGNQGELSPIPKIKASLVWTKKWKNGWESDACSTPKAFFWREKIFLKPLAGWPSARK